MKIIEVDKITKTFNLENNKSTFSTLREKFFFKFCKKNKTLKKLSTNFYALKDVSFSVQKGEIVGLIGKNGSGKSTLLKILSRIYLPTKGRISIKGKVASLLEVGTGFHPELTGRENIYLNGSLLGLKKYEINNSLNKIIEFSEIGEFIDVPVKKYSSGMYVRLAFSVSVFLSSEIIIIDEVLAVGDLEFQKKCINFILNNTKQSGRTMFVVSHNLGLIQSLCDRCLYLDRGKIIFDGKTENAIDMYLSQESSCIGVNKLQYKTKIDGFYIENVTMGGEAICYNNDVKFIINLVNKIEILENLRVAVQILNSRLSIVLTSKIELEIIPIKKHSIELLVKSPKLPPGNYTVNLGIGRNNTEVFYKTQIQFFKVENNHISDPFILNRRDNLGVYIEGSYKISK